MTLDSAFLRSAKLLYPEDDIDRLAAMSLEELQHCYDAAALIYGARCPIHYGERHDQARILTAILEMRERFRKDGGR